MCVTATLDAIKKCGHFQANKEAQGLYVAKKEAVKQAKAGLSLLDGAGEGSGKSKKSSKYSKEAEGVIKAPDFKMQAFFQADLEKAKEPSENAKGATTAAANKMLAFYANLLSVKANYRWSKIVEG